MVSNQLLFAAVLLNFKSLGIFLGENCCFNCLSTIQKEDSFPLGINSVKEQSGN